MPTSTPTIQPDDGSILTPDVTPEALTPPPGPTGEPPNVHRLASLFGENADARHISLVGLFILAVLYTLHLAQAFILPIVLAILLDFLLSPIVRALRRARIPEPVGAAIVMLGLVGALVVGGWYLSGPAAAWLARAPESLATIEAKLETLRAPVEQVSEAAKQVEEATAVGEEGTPQVEVKGPSLISQVFGGTTALLSAATVVFFLTYFLLAVGDLFLQKLVAVLPQFRDKKTAVSIARATEAQISSYLFTATLINAGVGVFTAVVLWLVGMPNPILWGVLAAVLNFVPYVGALTNTVILSLAALLTFESVARALVVPGVFVLINVLEGNLITPLIHGNRMRLNTVAMFIGFVFWWYLWGIPGAIMAVPLTAAIKITCDHIESLAPVGEFLGK